MKTKILLTLLYLATLAGYIIAQTPGFNYQAVLRDAQGEVMPNAEITLIISLTDGADGPVLYKENHLLLTNELGILNAMVGSGTIESGTLASIIGVSDLNIKLEADIPGEPDVVDIGNSPVGATPFALYGEDADADPANEMQSLSLEGDTLKISGSAGVSLENIKSPLERVENGYRLDLKSTKRDTPDFDIVDIFFGSKNGISMSGEDDSRFNFTSLHSNRGIGDDLLDESYGPIHAFLPELALGTMAELIGKDVETISNANGRVRTAPDLVEVEALIGPGEGFHYSTLGEITRLTKQLDQKCLQAFYRDGDILGDAFYDGTNGSVGLDFFSAGEVFGGGFLVNSTASLAAFRTLGAFGLNNLAVQVGSTTSGGGDVTIRSNTGKTASRSTTIPENGGVFIIYDTTGTNEKIRLGCDELGKAGIWIDGDRVLEPTRASERQKISDEGTIQLVDGEATVYCDHEFTNLADPAKVTVHLTPLSATSQGLAVIEKFKGGFKIKEMHNGQGNYELDWLARSEIRESIEEKRTALPQLSDIKKWPDRPIKNMLDFVDSKK